MRRVGRLAVWPLAALAVSGCGTTEIVMPGSSTIVVATVTSGSQIDSDGYMVRLDQGDPVAIGVQDSVTFPEVEEGEHELTLSGIARNCGTEEANPRTVTVTSGTRARVAFNVVCAEAGALAVATETTGDSADTRYSIRIGGDEPYLVDAVGTLTLTALPVGVYEVELAGVSVNCTVAGVNPRQLEVSAGQLAETTFEVTCVAALLDRIVFATDRDGNFEVYSMTDRGFEAANLTRHPATDRGPALSRDGMRIAFSSDRDGDFDIYVMDSDGTGLTQLTDAPGDDSQPDWSPDGRKIVFVSERDGNLEIYVMNADGSNPYNVSRHPSRDASPAWSPDGELIAFNSDRVGDNEIGLIRADGTSFQFVTASRGDDVSPTWSPDGSKLAFSSLRDGNWEIYLRELGSSMLLNLTNQRGADIEPAWSPDGRRIAIATDREGDLEIYWFDLLSRRVQKLTEGDDVDTWPAWSPLR